MSSSTDFLSHQSQWYFSFNTYKVSIISYILCSPILFSFVMFCTYFVKKYGYSFLILKIVKAIFYNNLSDTFFSESFFPIVKVVNSFLLDIFQNDRLRFLTDGTAKPNHGGTSSVHNIFLHASGRILMWIWYQHHLCGFIYTPRAMEGRPVSPVTKGLDKFKLL